MAKATITAVCAECGETFEVIKRNLRNLDAAEQYKEWAKDNIDICPECYTKYAASLFARPPCIL